MTGQGYIGRGAKPEITNSSCLVLIIFQLTSCLFSNFCLLNFAHLLPNIICKTPPQSQPCSQAILQSAHFSTKDCNVLLRNHDDSSVVTCTSLTYKSKASAHNHLSLRPIKTNAFSMSTHTNETFFATCTKQDCESFAPDRHVSSINWTAKVLGLDE